MAKTPEEKVYVDLYEDEKSMILKYERGETSCVTRFRIIEASTEPKIRIDIREFLKSRTYVGWTGRGITFVPENIESVIKSLLKLKEKAEELSKPKAKKSTKKG